MIELAPTERALEGLVTHEEIAAVFAPYVREGRDSSDPRWIAEVQNVARRLRFERISHAMLRPLAMFRRTQRAVSHNYTRQWLERPIEMQVAPDGPVVPCEWRDRGMYARAVGTKRVHLLCLNRVIERLRPRRVLEVGCGNGINLFALGARFGDVDFVGIELTEGGVRAAQDVRRRAVLPDAVIEFIPEPARDRSPFKRIHLVQGSAERLPFPNASFDVVFTALALEQMEEIRSSALAEIRRVAREHTAMIEPFYDWNCRGRQRDYVLANDYFRGTVADLKGVGLEPILTFADMPSKLHYRPALVVCRVP